MNGNSKLLFAMTGCRGYCGGIASANLNVLHALVGLARERGAGLTVFSLLEKESDRPEFLPRWVRFRAFQGNRGLFAVNLLRETVGRPIFCFDHVRLAFPLVPFAAARVVKTVIFAHGSESWKRIRRTSLWSFRYATLCLTNSHFTLKKMLEVIGNINAAACPLGLSPDFALNGGIPRDIFDGPIELEAADGSTRPLGKRYFLLVARMLGPRRDSDEGQKGHRSLIRILPELLPEFPDVQLVFPGPGDDRQDLRELAQKEGVASSVFLPGAVSHERLQSLYGQCYAFVMPSKQEGFGLAYLEAMNYAKPCVGCFDQGAEDVIVHGETGLLVHEPSDREELCRVLLSLLRDPESARAMGKNGFERLRECFSSRHAQERIKGQIAAILEGGKLSRPPRQ